MKHRPPGKSAEQYAVEEMVAKFLTPYPEGWWSIDELITGPLGESADVVVYVRGIFGPDDSVPHDVRVDISIRAVPKPARHTPARFHGAAAETVTP